MIFGPPLSNFTQTGEQESYLGTFIRFGNTFTQNMKPATSFQTEILPQEVELKIN